MVWVTKCLEIIQFQPSPRYGQGHLLLDHVTQGSVQPGIYSPNLHPSLPGAVIFVASSSATKLTDESLSTIIIHLLCCYFVVPVSWVSKLYMFCTHLGLHQVTVKSRFLGLHLQ